MKEDYILEFISQEDFEKHIKDTLLQYKNTLSAINLKKVNSNLIDPIKLTFDKAVFDKSLEDIIELEIHRQRDKSNNNIIGYFHQNIFKYIKNCEVLNKGWDIIFRNGKTTYYVEMKNKHNTMNSSSSSATYLKMKNFLSTLDENSSNAICVLVEVIAKKSQNIPWKISINQESQDNERIRKISIDRFYEIITGDKEAFKKLCDQLIITINKIAIEKNNDNFILGDNTVLQELEEIDKDKLLALYKLAFSTYQGF